MSTVRGAGGRAFVLAGRRVILTGPPGDDRRLITDYEQARRFLVDPRQRRASLLQVPSGPASAMSVTDMDAPQHTRVRALLSAAFSHRAVERRLPAMEYRARALAEGMRAAGPCRDALAEFCVPFAYAVHCDLLGVPEHARQTLYRRSCARSQRPDADGVALYRAELALHSAVGELLDHHDVHPGLLRDLLGVHRSGALEADELKGLAASLFFDGHILAANQLANALMCLFAHQHWMAGLIAEPALLDPTVEETLRFSPAITVGMTRVDAAGVRTAVAFGPANRDSNVFQAPNRFDPTRTGPRHLSFGLGPHHCLGAALMRAELRVALTTLLTHLPGLRPAVEDRGLSWTSTGTVRGLIDLPLTWDR
ncbi:cytochrome P450 [Streptomyces sp. CT34]|uniref:cytochrome P450 n=1 Tax=Streptomyces sp. CT34 TaxID=1553907 RepID=UPI0012FE8E78|nr:cytochrome P450 [Streptomyces sp. CT34]